MRRANDTHMYRLTVAGMYGKLTTEESCKHNEKTIE